MAPNPVKEERIPETQFFQFRSLALFYFPNLPRYLRRLNISNRRLAAETAKIDGTGVTEGTIRRMAIGEPVAFQSVKSVFKTIERLWNVNLDEEREIVKAMYLMRGLESELEDLGKTAADLESACDLPGEMIEDVLRGARVPFVVGLRLLEAINEWRAGAGKKPLNPRDMLVPEPRLKDETDLNRIRASRRSALGQLEECRRYHILVPEIPRRQGPFEFE